MRALGGGRKKRNANMEGPAKIVKVITADEVVLEMPYRAAMMSKTIANMLDDIPDEIDAPIPLPNVMGNVMQRVIEFCVHHMNEPEPAEGDPKRTEIEPWDQEFCKMDQALLFTTILAANYLDIKLLLDATCKTVAQSLKGLVPEEIRKKFNIKNDFTPEEEAQVRKENEWCEDK
jgi:S-phase kinase-associated protein 1